MKKRTLFSSLILLLATIVYFCWIMIAFRQHAPAILFFVSFLTVSGVWAIYRKMLAASIFRAAIAGLIVGVLASVAASTIAEIHLRGMQFYLSCCVRPNTNYVVLSLCWLYASAFFVAAKFLNEPAGSNQEQPDCPEKKGI